MGLYSGGLIIGRIFPSEILGGLFSGGLIIVILFIYLFLVFFGRWGGDLLSGFFGILSWKHF